MGKTARNCGDILAELKDLHSPENLAGMARFGINTENALGVPVTTLRRIARNIRRNHDLAAELWASGSHEARILAGMVDEPERVTEVQLEHWVLDFDSWDLCDQLCANLFEKTPLAWDKCVEWSRREEEFVRRAALALMARLAVSDKGASDDQFEVFFPLIKREAGDSRNFVKKAVNWALRQIGKRNPALRGKAIACAREIAAGGTRSGRWIASDALRELSDKVTPTC